MEYKYDLFIYSEGRGGVLTEIPMGIEVTNPPNKIEYTEGDNLELDGIEVKAKFSNDTQEEVTSECAFKPANHSELKRGDSPIIITWNWKNIADFKAEQEITINEGIKIVSWASGTDQEIVDMVAAADAGLINLTDHWAVGEERKVWISEIEKSSVGGPYSAQYVILVLMNEHGKTLQNGKTCSYIVGLKDVLNGPYGKMNTSQTNSGGWRSCEMREWCNNNFKNAIPTTLRSIFKPFKNLSGTGGGSSSGTVETIDTWALAAEAEVFDINTNSVIGEGTQFEYYKTSSNRVKLYGIDGQEYSWWMRSPYPKNGTSFCRVYSDGSNDYAYADSIMGISLFGCI